MSFYNLIRTALYSIRAYKIRIFLTMIGIIIGISSVSAILAIGEGLKSEASNSIESANLNKITINYSPSVDSTGNETPFEEDQLSEIEKIEGVNSVNKNEDQNALFNFNFQEAKYFDRTISIDIKNYDKDQPKRNIIYGRDMTASERKGERRLVLLNNNDAEGLFGEAEEAIGKGIELKGEIYEVIGVTEGLEFEMNLEFREPDDFELNAALVPESIVLEQETEGINNIAIAVGSEREKEEIITEVKEKLKELNPEARGEYVEFDVQEILEEVQGIIDNITLFVAFVTGISLLVGGIGVMNIMYVSVTERKREIGIRRAIGAKPRSILAQFLMEAIFITGLGGLIGIGTGYLLSMAIGTLLPFTPVMTPSNFVLASSISVITGLVFGIVPASKAAKLDPIVAIYN